MLSPCPPTAIPSCLFRKAVSHVAPSPGCEESLTDENSFGGHAAEDNWIWKHPPSKCIQVNISCFLLSYSRKPQIGAIIMKENLILLPRGQAAPPTLIASTTFYGQSVCLLTGHSGSA